MKTHKPIFRQLGSGALRKTRGISLAIVMIFLVILSVLGISAVQTSTFSSRIARNESDRNLALQAAEAGLRDAEQDTKSLKFDNTPCVAGSARCRASPINRGNGFDNLCTLGLCDPALFANPVWEDKTKWTATGGSVAYGTNTGATDLPVVSQQPRYLIEYFSFFETTVYRITVIGYGASPSSQVMIQSTVKALAI